MKIGAHRRFICYTLALGFAGMIAVALFNRAVNPFGVFATDWVSRPAKPGTFTHLRMVKAYQVRHQRPRAVSLGSSRVEMGLPASSPHWVVKPVYNLGLSGGTIYEILRYFQHACAVSDIQQAVLLLDYTAFLASAQVAPDFTETRLAVDSEGTPAAFSKYADWGAATATMDALQASWNTFRKVRAEHQYLPDGTRDAAADTFRVLSKGGSAKAFAALEADTPPKLIKLSPKLDEASLEYLRTLLRLARKHGVDLRLGIAPVHARYLEMLHLSGHGPSYDKWQQRLVESVEEESSKDKPFKLRDFSGYNQYTTEAVPASGLGQWYFEDSHFTAELGNLLLKQVLHERSGAEPAVGDFGVALSSANVVAHQAAVRVRRTQYQENRREELEQLRSLFDSIQIGR